MILLTLVSMMLLNKLLPAQERRAIFKRMLIVWTFAAFIGFALWAAQGFGINQLAKQMVYSFAISTCIWFLSDVVCLLIFRQTRMQATRQLGRGLFFAFSIVLGYVLGTLIADAYSGWSSWSFFSNNLGRLIGMLVMSVMISLGFSVFFYQSERFELTKRQAIDAKLKLLESQLEPHMLFNTLANLRYLITNDPTRAIDMLDRLNNYLRATLGGSRNTFHTLSAEFERLRDYLELMSVRMGNRLHYQLNLPTKLEQFLIPPLLLQPIVENAIKHGLEPTIDGGHITIYATIVNNVLYITIQDTGIGGVSATDFMHTKGFGINQVRERLSTTYGKAANLTLIENHNSANDQTRIGTTIRINIPAHTTAQFTK